MATPHFSEYIEAVGSGGTLLFGSKAIGPGDHMQLLGVGGSVGGNLRVGATAGRDPFDRERDELSVSLVDVLVDGAWDQDNVAVAAGSQRGNLLSLMRTVANFWDDFCTGRQFTLRLTEPAGVWEGAAQFEQLGVWRPVEGSTVAAEVNVRITLSDGRLTQVS